MSRLSFILMVGAIAVLAFAGMWIAWRGRTKRDTSALGALGTAATPLTGALLASFPRASYVSTTPVGAPFERLAIPGLRYKGYADVEVHRDGVSIAVTGEAPVQIAATQLSGSGTAASRVGKAVEPNGLSLLRWQIDAAADRPARDVESSFRFTDPAEQQRFADAITTVLESGTGTTPMQTMTQEDA